MLRPEKMCRVSVTGSKRVMGQAIEAVHDLDMLHVTEYDGSWDGFEPGDPVKGADSASDQLVTVRSLQSILDVDEEDAGPTRLVTDDALEEDLEEIRTQVNELDDRRDDIRDDLRDVEERISTMEPFVTLGIDLDLLRDYESLAVAVGEGDADEVKIALADSDVDTFEVRSEDDVVAVFAQTDESTLQDTLVGATFSGLEIPDGDGDPTEYLEELQHQKQKLESKLGTVEDELDDLRLDYAGFLLAAEEKLSIEVQKAEAPLTFATTENAFIAEGWIPNERYSEFESAVEADVSEAVDIEKLEIAEYDEGHVHSREEVEHEGGNGGVEEDEEATITEAGDTSQEAVADGGLVTMDNDQPPVIQDNPGVVRPFEDLVEVVNRPKYSEFDPTVVFFLTFPAFYGFMIGDLGYGLLYFLAGYFLYSNVESDVLKSLGGVAMWAGGFTALFGVLYGEFFGLHQLGEIVWGGNPPIHKGLQPVYGDYAIAWLTISLLAGMLHLAIGWTFDFVKNLGHGLWDAVTESGSWLLMLFGLWAWVFSGANGAAPNFLYTAEEGIFAGHPFALGFAGLPAINLFTIPGLGAPFSAWLILFFAGLVLLALADPIEVVEFLNVFVNVLSYTRLAAVLLAKAGMAFVVNLLFFGVYVVETGHGAEWHFGINHSPAHMLAEGTYHGHEVTEVMFGGLMHSGIAGVVGGLLVLVLGHVLVLVLGVTSAGLQGVRLEYVEFFGKFFEGGGKAYSPFGYERNYTTDD
ncbi:MULTISPECIES: V-type ATP synthase subunit I [Haloarcula]|uniref:A-type ATP synthase subunit I n=1 Tax=Haloarcula pellucida TaxID=1427151 RepID=A0A830GLC9_9EURY|nr:MULTISPECIES: V-type ATPase 116kDa subunit family protein [Halomicroarcula]MBX0348834.1 V-type ATP synthase subunit I [Halomicroarcula pellucida]MDS0278597.1 V-type ATP synthase subunit I [Halomicroarcula sp. S1AR25-4]GGN91615.1 ATP synthase subunit I [Halomicroarcula pellucida]